jgi:hypothetical protein
MRLSEPKQLLSFKIFRRRISNAVGVLTMKYGELNNLFSVIIGTSIVLIGCVIAYFSQKHLFTQKFK